MRLIFVRHGQSQGNVAGDVSSAPPGCDLTQVGIDQAQATAEALAKTYQVHRMYCSPILRTYHTAQVLNQHFGVQQILLDARLSEMFFGEYDGRSSGLMFDDWQKFMIQVGQRDYSARIGQVGESEFAFRDRLLSFLIETAVRYQPDEVIVVVTHQAPAKLLQQMIEPEVEAMLLGNAETVTMQLTEDHVRPLIAQRQQLLSDYLMHIDRRLRRKEA